MRIELVCLLLALFSTRSRALKMVRLTVPPQVDFRKPVVLTCEHDLEGINLYSVKWYKDEFEFFRFMPDYTPNSQAFPVPGITLDLESCNMNQVRLINLSFNSSGNYKCEVSTEAPNFETVAQSSNMTVMAFPVEDPMIEGVLSTYSIGDFVSANCTSGKSNPAARIVWYINGNKVDGRVWEYKQGSDEVDAQGLHTKTVGLHFQVTRNHFQGGGGGATPRMEIRCTATVGDHQRHKSVYPSIARLTNQKLAQERSPNSVDITTPLPLQTLLFVLASSVHSVFSS